MLLKAHAAPTSPPASVGSPCPIKTGKMLRSVKPKTARGKRVQKEREGKIHENPKNALFLKSSTSSQASLKKPFAVTFGRKNDLHPFIDHQPLEFFSQKNDTSLFVVGSHSKKRPHTLTFGRTYDFKLLDMMEISLSNYKSFKDFKLPGCGLGQKPTFIFSGALFETSRTHQMLKSMILDFYRGEELKEISLVGLEHVISITAASNDPAAALNFRVYAVMLKKSGTKTPRVELGAMGPNFDFTIGRVRAPDDEMWKQAVRKPAAAKPKKIKNISKDEMGDTVGKIHVGRQDLTQIQTRKMKGLKRKRETTDGEQAAEEATAE